MSKPDPTPEATPAAVPAPPPPAHGGSFILDPATGERRLRHAPAPAVAPVAVQADPPQPDPAPAADLAAVEPPQKGTRK